MPGGLRLRFVRPGAFSKPQTAVAWESPPRPASFVQEPPMVLRWLGRRCFVCRRPLLLHTIRQQYACEEKPLPLTLTDQGWLQALQAQPTAEVPLRK